ncbi:hypothetical protein [Paraburkholderia sp. BL21I4N1]|uniref:hypothetical protein n=1 Tax=Paraburkholderia sp. BL21I4N1 TaxID=1938801 RepID=UPI000D4E3AE7|nr:hypothetical protein [Paraburkholderia sp. BL21I4N1]PQV54708.1 hypothetical protein B0G83_101891 [Paraburkholderia sp. BL21I4N1]
MNAFLKCALSVAVLFTSSLALAQSEQYKATLETIKAIVEKSALAGPLLVIMAILALLAFLAMMTFGVRNMLTVVHPG